MCSLIFLLRYHSDSQHFIDYIVTGEGTWLHHFVPTSKKATMEWKHPGSPTTKKFKVTTSAGKVMATIFWDSLWCYTDRLLGVWPDYQRRSLLVHFDKITRNHSTQTAGHVE
ncbi:histone-lysine N-methyltransferase SETMAR [Trichonephila clavata]|uniref:Histone-lysine N-methyltransferase SETMAR n=1 Tax=Trichonephila clavata TaxID=2740835 RepID=A0A8X6FHS5_TRICU|nr:histone-lysine N-methyltransferase SETMAR [Trichonephila clavata]